jgi:hypothetical protein
MLNIGRGRPREHPKDTSEGSRDRRSLQVLHNFRLRMHTPKGTLKGSSDLRSHAGFPMVIGHERRREHSMDTSEGGHVTFGHYGCCATSGCT